MNIYILLLAGIAVFLVFRLRDVLGKPTGREKLEHPFEVISGRGGERDAEPDFSDAENAEALAKPLHDDEAIDHKLRGIRELDPSFHPAGFLDGSRIAFEMVLDAFASGDKDTLKGLLSQQVYEDFETAIDARVDAGETMQTTLVGFKNVSLVDADLSSQTATLTVRYVSEQISVTKDSDDEITEGHPTYVASIIDVWTFGRKVTSRDPNWSLVATESEEPAESSESAQTSADSDSGDNDD